MDHLLKKLGFLEFTGSGEFRGHESGVVSPCKRSD
jgi:hypothetical protein